MRCSYCCVGDKTEFSIITKEQLYRNFLFLARNTESLKEQNVDVILHGGEATMFAPSDCSFAIEKIISEFPLINFHWKIQTNGYHISDAWLNLLKKYHFSVGVSLDGYEKHHNSVRKDCIGNSTFYKIKSNILKLKQNDISVSTLMVVTKRALQNGYGFLDWYTENKIPIKINPLLQCGEAINKNDLFLKSGDYADYIIGAFEYLIQHDANTPLNPIDNMFERIVNQQNHGECIFSEDCTRNFMAIDYDGNLYPCGRFCDESQNYMGNVNEVVQFPFQKPASVIEKVQSYRNYSKCKMCKFYDFCHGGCPFVNQLESRGDSFINPLCEDYRKIYTYIVTHGIDLLCKKLDERVKVMQDEQQNRALL